jgi:shikimate kinase
MSTRFANGEPIVLIGPMKTGKTVVGRLLAHRLGCAFVSLDQLERHYAKVVGFDEHLASVIQSRQGDLAWYQYRRGFFDEVVVRFLAEHTHGVLELGGGHPILPDDEKQARVNQALAPFGNVVLLLPTSDIRESLAILKQRQKPEHLNPDLNELFLSDSRYFDLAKLVVYTQGKSADETCDEIIASLESQ